MQYIHYGCKTNQYESNAIIQKFIENGYKLVEFEEKADVYIVNTCTVTNISDRKSRQILRRAKQKNKDSILVVIGCYVQVARDILEEIKEIDILLGNNEKKDILEYVEKYQNERQEEITDVMGQREYVEFGITTFTEKTRAVIKIQDGCDRFCSYCIIPYARGRVRSRKIDEIVTEITEISKLGIKEVVLTGIHIASYGKDLKEEIALIDLLEEINKIKGIERIRLGSLEPKLITEEFVQRLNKLEKICNHFHLSLQSGCTETLKRMNRRYTAEEFLTATKLIRENFKDVMLTADVIVGFPGETKEEFEETYNFLKKIKFYKIHVFKYSVREGTKAASFSNQVSPEIKEERSKKVIELSERIQNEYNKRYIGREVKVLFEEKENEYYKGHTENYMCVKLKTEDDKLENLILNTKIISTENGVLLRRTKQYPKCNKNVIILQCKFNKRIS